MRLPWDVPRLSFNWIGRRPPAFVVRCFTWNNCALPATYWLLRSSARNWSRELWINGGCNWPVVLLGPCGIFTSRSRQHFGIASGVAQDGILAACAGHPAAAERRCSPERNSLAGPSLNLIPRRATRMSQVGPKSHCRIMPPFSG